MSHTSTMLLWHSWKIPAPITAVALCRYPCVMNSYDFATRSGVRSSPLRSGSSPIAVRMPRTCAAMAVMSILEHLDGDADLARILLDLVQQVGHRLHRLPEVSVEPRVIHELSNGAVAVLNARNKRIGVRRHGGKLIG